jgi:hypothetical protein
MNIRPTQSGQTRGPAADRLKEPVPNPAVQKDRAAEPAPRPPGADQVELSDAARELLQRAGIEPSGVSTLPRERMREVLQRIAQGFYDRPEVRDETLRRLSGDLESGPNPS